MRRKPAPPAPDEPLDDHPYEEFPFWQRVDKGPDDDMCCWLWTGTVAKKSRSPRYHCPDGRQTGAHRIAWRILRPDEPLYQRHVLAHLCDNPHCVRPEHRRPRLRHKRPFAKRSKKERAAPKVVPTAAEVPPAIDLQPFQAQLTRLDQRITQAASLLLNKQKELESRATTRQQHVSKRLHSLEEKTSCILEQLEGLAASKQQDDAILGAVGELLGEVRALHDVLGPGPVPPAESGPEATGPAAPAAPSPAEPKPPDHLALALMEAIRRLAPAFEADPGDHRTVVRVYDQLLRDAGGDSRKASEAFGEAVTEAAARARRRGLPFRVSALQSFVPERASA